MKFDIVNSDEVLVKENGAKRLAKVSQRITIRSLPEKSDGEVTWTCERTGERDHFVEIDGEFFEDTKLTLVRNGQLPKPLFEKERWFFVGSRERCFYEEDIIDWSATIKRKAASLRLFGTKIWRRSPGPVLKIASKQYGWHTRLVSGQPELRNDHLFTFHFGLDELDEAKSWLAKLVAEGRPGSFGELEEKHFDGPYVKGVYLDAINAANTLRANFEGIFDVEYLSRGALKHYASLAFWLGNRDGREANWPPHYVPLDVSEMSDDDCMRLLRHSAELAGLIRKAGKKNFPQQSKNFDRHIRRAEEWIAGNWPGREGLLTKLATLEPETSLDKEGDHDEDDDDDPTIY
ncbi:hypothetical protein HFN89_05760 [Rhizobium laguerreae]|nr:hypothetical protein [Rhizobium laguerreae]